VVIAPIDPMAALFDSRDAVEGPLEKRGGRRRL
jgi:hypothetical protein